ncbi:MAG: acyl-CoA dehydrogenase family protein [Deltaproteobacteria bacterium]|nr:acyl-CoA dehydrogenase family protein [Deltaproteobacteria bacterium]MBW2416035.1 acyl-CoA dehydrogenase family protein [Deltaproteobacteria bacterium]
MQEMLRDRADEIEAARRLPQDISDRFGQAGFYRMCVPAPYGGLELPPAITMQTVETLARADGSAAWCVFIGATSGSALAGLCEAAAREVFARPETLVAGVVAPRGRAEMVDDGFRVNGRWQWGSATQNADWVLGGSMLQRGGEPVLGPHGMPRSHMMLAKASEVQFHDTWYVSGLSGTGSTDFEMRDAFVPAERAVGFEPGPRPEGALYAFPTFGLLAMGIAAVSLGLARAAIDELVAVASGKTPQGSNRTLDRRPAVQADVSEAEALLRSSRAFYYEAIEEAWEAARTRGEIHVDQRRDLRLATTHAVRSCASAVDLMYHVAGGTSVYSRSPLQRIFRDVHVATQHMMASRSTLELTGRLFLGLETDTSLL